MERKMKVYKAEDLLRRVRVNINELIHLKKEIDEYLEKIETRRADNRSSIEDMLKLELGTRLKKKGGKYAKVS